jgi:hypothetical protein
MPYITDHKQKFDDLKFHLENQDQLRRKANGGNSILFSYPPDEEQQYIAKANELWGENLGVRSQEIEENADKKNILTPNSCLQTSKKAAFIDISNLLVQFIDKDGWETFKEYYNDFKNTPHKVFRSDDPTPDLFDVIISEIDDACRNNKIPFLMRTGCLYGTGIENVNIMEHKAVMNQPHPLVIFYPSIIEEDNIYFLNFKPASKYRCILVK